MLKAELLARLAAFLILIGFPVGVFAHQQWHAPAGLDDVKVIDLVAESPESGGWSPEIVTVNKGDRVRLRITSRDVVHGFAIGQMDIDAGRIMPGDVMMVDFVADRAGRFTYYCDVWCSPNHPRMRGVLEVVDPERIDGEPVPELAVDFTQLDIDSPHPAAIYPHEGPDAAAGKLLADQAGITIPAVKDVRRMSPASLFQAIKQQDLEGILSDTDIWDFVAYTWLRSASSESLADGEALYNQNCLACHGQSGRGDGPGSRYVEHELPDFTRASTAAGATSEIYFAKIRRGGMGTGMPYWGTIFTTEETWSLVDYLWSLFFTYPEPQ